MKSKIISIILTAIICISSVSATNYVSAKSRARTSNEIIYDSYNNNSINNIWNIELSSALSISCDWLSNQPNDKLSYLALGSSGKSASAKDVNYYISDLSLKDNFTSLLNLSYSVLNSTFCGYNATNILGNNLIKQFYKIQNIQNQSLESLCYALLAVNSNPYKIDEDNSNFNTKMCIDAILNFQNQDGGFKLTYNADNSDVSSTALALIALSEYKEDANIINSIKLALEYLKQKQNKYGDFQLNGKASSIPLSYVVIAFCSLGIPLHTPEFNPTGENLISMLVNKYSNIDGSFARELNGDGDVFATQLAILALSATRNNKSPFKLNNPLVVTQTKISKETINKDSNKLIKNIPAICAIIILILIFTITINIKRKRRK